MPGLWKVRDMKHYRYLGVMLLIFQVQLWTNALLGIFHSNVDFIVALVSAALFTITLWLIVYGDEI